MWHLVHLDMADRKDRKPLALWLETEITQVGGGGVMSSGPQMLYERTAQPVRWLKGQREYFGHPPVVRVTGDYGRPGTKP